MTTVVDGRRDSSGWRVFAGLELFARVDIGGKPPVHRRSRLDDVQRSRGDRANRTHRRNHRGCANCPGGGRRISTRNSRPAGSSSWTTSNSSRTLTTKTLPHNHATDQSSKFGRVTRAVLHKRADSLRAGLLASAGVAFPYESRNPETTCRPA